MLNRLNFTLTLTEAFLFLCCVRDKEVECKSPGGPRLHLVCTCAGSGRSIRDCAEWKYQSSHCCGAKSVGQPWTNID